MTRSRRKFSAEQKATIVRRHFKDKTAISALAEEYAVQPSQIHQWVALALEQIQRSFEHENLQRRSAKRAEAKLVEIREDRIKRLEEKLAHKNELIAA